MKVEAMKLVTLRSPNVLSLNGVTIMDLQNFLQEAISQGAAAATPVMDYHGETISSLMVRLPLDPIAYKPADD